MAQTIALSSGGGGSGGIIMIVLVVIVFLFIWMWRSQQGQAQQPGQTPFVINTPGSPAAPAATTPPPGTTAPPPTTCNCTANASCNAFCSNVSAFNLCCYGNGTTPPPVEEEEELPDENAALCTSQFNGSCNTECGNNGDIDECEECNAVCGSDVAYTGPDIVVPPPANAGAVQGVCNCGTNQYCNQFCYSANLFNMCCFGPATAAPVTPAPTTPNPPPNASSGANPTRCKNTYNGKCDSECSGGSQSECNDCMIACGQATAGAANAGGTSGGSANSGTCKSKYNGSCNTECSGGSSSTCNSCRAACGLSGNIASVVSVRQARKLLNNRLYNSMRARMYNPNVAVTVGYNLRRGFRVGNLR